MKFIDIIPSKDGGFIIAGHAMQERWVFTLLYANYVGILIKIDRYGNIVWCKKFDSANGFLNTGFDIGFTNVMETVSGDLIAYLATSYGRNYQGYSKIICLNNAGVVKWTTLMATGEFDGGISSLSTKRDLLQSRDNSIVIGDIMYRTDKSTPNLKPVDAQLHFYSMDAVTGKIKWETNYEYPMNSAPYITGIHQLQDGKFVFNTSSYQQTGFTKGLRITTDEKGDVISSIGYGSNTDHVQLTDVIYDKLNGNQSYLFKVGFFSLIANVNDSGTINWQRGFDDGNSQFPANCFSSMNNGYGILGSNFNSHNSRLLITDTGGLINCANIPLTVQSESITLTKAATVKTDMTALDPNRAGQMDFSMKTTEYYLQKKIDCEEVAICCNDIIDSTNMQHIQICEGSSFTLPDNTVVKSTGTYYVTFKLAGGCDSVRYYKVNVNKNPSALTLGNDICFKERDSAILTATPGYNSYSWMNNNAGIENEFKVYKPGIYYVRVANVCGSKTDSLSILEECNYPVYMPAAFSPNNDGLNDQFQFPAMNKNLFVSMKIFDRMGQPVFYSKDSNKGWDGRIGNHPQSTGVYAYVLELKGLSGEKIVHKGTLLLIR